MPEAAVDKDDGGIPGQDDVRFSLELAIRGAIDREAEAEAVEEGAHPELGLGVLALDEGHDLTAAFGRPLTGFHLGGLGVLLRSCATALWIFRVSVKTRVLLVPPEKT